MSRSGCLFRRLVKEPAVARATLKWFLTSQADLLEIVLASPWAQLLCPSLRIPVQFVAPHVLVVDAERGTVEPGHLAVLSTLQGVSERAGTGQWYRCAGRRPHHEPGHLLVRENSQRALLCQNKNAVARKFFFRTLFLYHTQLLFCVCGYTQAPHEIIYTKVGTSSFTGLFSRKNSRKNNVAEVQKLVSRL